MNMRLEVNYYMQEERHLKEYHITMRFIIPFSQSGKRRDGRHIMYHLVTNESVFFGI